jgi:hypothetical protein
MRRVLWVALLVASVGLAGCSDGGAPPEDGPSAADDIQEEYDVKPTDTKGVLLGVVVDEAIRPVEAVKIALNLADGTLQEKTSDAEGRFAFGDLEPGVYLLEFSHGQYATLATSVDVKAGEEDPPVHRFQVTRLFAQEPFTEMITYDGYIACAYAFFLSSTCVNDYTRVPGCLNPSACPCPGGCFRDQEVAKQGGNKREYVSVVGPGWQSIIIEATWEPTSDLGKELGFTVSYYSRPTTSHWYGSTGGPNPLRLQLDVGVPHDSVSSVEPHLIDANGTEELFTFFSANSENVAANQAFQAFQTVYYYAIPPEDWSFIVDGAPPY